MHTGPQLSLGRLFAPVHLDATDGALLARFITARDEAAFAALVQRHGPMVLGVCRRILGASDAEDAFQATFLVLVRRAAELTGRTVIGDWLHGVARRVALKARACVIQRRTKEATAARPESRPADPRNDWLPVLDDELARLPEKYQLPIILCDLESRTRADAARQLGWPEGTVAARLARGRALLAKRLLQRTLGFVGGLAPILSDEAAQGGVPAPLLAATLRLALGGPSAPVSNAGVEALARSVLRPARLYYYGLATAVGAALLGASLGAFGMGTFEPPVPSRAQNEAPPASPPAPGTARPAAPEPPAPAAEKRPVGAAATADAKQLEYGIEVEVRGVVLSTLNGDVIDITNETSRTQVRFNADREGLVVAAQDLNARDVIATGRLALATVGTRRGGSDVVMALHNVRMKGVPADEQKVEQNRGIKATVRGVLGYQGERIGGGWGYHVLIPARANDQPELRVWLPDVGERDPEMGAKKRGAEIVLTGRLFQAGENTARVPHRELFLRAAGAGAEPGGGAAPQVGAGKSVGRIDAEARGVLKFEEGWGYFVDTAGNGLAATARVWLRAGEDKVTARRLEALRDEDVVATGALRQNPAGTQSAVPGMGLYLSRFDIERAPKEPEKARQLPPGVRVTVWGTLKHENPRVEGGGGYHILLTARDAQPDALLETRVWLWYDKDRDEKKIEGRLDKEVVVRGLLLQAGKRAGVLEGGMYFRDFEVREATAGDRADRVGVKQIDPIRIDRTPSTQRVWYTFEGTAVGYYLLPDGKLYPGTVRNDRHVIWHRARPLLMSEYVPAGAQRLPQPIDSSTIDYLTEPLPGELKRVTAPKEMKGE